MNKLSKISNLNTIELIESSSELFKLNKYKSKEYVESHIGLALNRSSFYGILNGDEIIPLKESQLEFNSSSDINLLIEGIVILNSTPVNIGTGNIVYNGYGVLEVNGSVIYDGRNTGGGGATTFDELTDTPANKTGAKGRLVRIDQDEASVTYPGPAFIMPGDSNAEIQTCITEASNNVVYIVENSLTGYTSFAQNLVNDRVTISGIGKPTLIATNSTVNIFTCAFSDLNSNKVIVFRNLSFNSNNGRTFRSNQVLTGKLTVIFENCEFIGNANPSSQIQHISVESAAEVVIKFVNCRNTSNLGQTQVMTDPTRFMLFSAVNKYSVEFDNCEFNYGKGAFLDLRHSATPSGNSYLSLRNCDITATDTISDGTGQFLVTGGGTFNNTLFVELNDVVFNYQGIDAFPVFNLRFGVGSTGTTVFNYMNNNIVNWNNGTGYIVNPNTTYSETGDGTVRYNGVTQYDGRKHKTLTTPTSPITPKNNDIILWDCTSGNKIVNLPEAAKSVDYRITVKKIDATANTITIDGFGAELVEGAATAVITTQWEALTFVCNGTAWFIIY